MRRSTILRTTGIILLTLGAVAAVGAIIVRDQIDRHQRDLFSPQPLKRFAALSYIAGLTASVELIRVLRDFIAWEPRTMLRQRARQIMDRMEHQLQEHGGISIPHPGIAG